jgi:hypothetical protein
METESLTKMIQGIGSQFEGTQNHAKADDFDQLVKQIPDKEPKGEDTSRG